MANNPLYPGYSPRKLDEEAINPIYPGYYTGQPIQRRPASKNFVQPVEYNVDAYMDALDDAGRKVLLAPFAAPRWLVERIVDDWKQNLKVAVKPGGVEMTELDDYETEDYPGVAAELSLNPLDWTKDFKKQFTKTIDSWSKGVTGIDRTNLLNSDFSDIENPTIFKLWTHALGFGEAKGIEEAAATGIAQRTVAPFTGYEGKDPLNLKWIKKGPVGRQRLYEDKRYKETAFNAAKFASQFDNSKERDGLHSKFLTSAVIAANDEIQSKWRSPHLRDRSILDRHEGAIALFRLNTEIIADIDKYTNKKLEYGGWKNAASKIQKNLTMISKKDKEDLGYVWEALRLATDEAKSKNALRLSEGESLFRSRKISENKFNNLKKNLDACNGNYDKLSANVDGLLTGTTTENDVLKVLNGVGIKPLAKRSMTVGLTPILDDLNKVQEYSLSSKEKDQMGSVFQDDDLLAAGVSFNASKLGPISYRLRQERVRGATKELLTAWDKEKILETYLWKELKNRMPTRVRYLASGGPAGQYLKNHHYFNLKLGDDPESFYFPTSKDSDRYFQKHPEKLAGFINRHAYKVDLKFGEKFAAAYGISKFTVHGGDEFKIFDNKLLKNFDVGSVQNKDFMMKLFGGPGTLTADEISQKLFGLNYNKLNDEDKDKYRDFILQSKAYTDWVNSLRDKFGDSVDNPLFRYLLFGEVLKNNNSLNDGYTLSRKVIGGLEKIHNKLLSLQKKFQASFLGKGIKFLQTWKTMISEQIGKWVAKIVSKLIASIVGAAAAATGILAVLGPAIGQIVEFAVQKLLTYTETWIKGIIKWDFRDLAKMFEKDVNKVIKSCIVVSLGCSLALFLPIMFLLMLVVGSVSPIDQTINTTEYGIGEFAPNENDVAIVEKSVIVTLSNGNKLTNPSEITNEQAVGAKVEYTITITPKVNIYDNSVKYLDTARHITEGSARSIPLGIGTLTATPFIEGNVLTKPGGSFNLNSSYKDSLITNTAIVDTPAVPSQGIDAGSISASKYIRIGNYVPLCPTGLGDFKVLTISYNENVPGSHGSDAYCAVNPGICASSQPYTWGAQGPRRECEKGSCQYWGYALDVTADQTGRACDGGAPVTLPPLLGATSWKITNVVTNNGAQNHLEATSDNGWRISLTHIQDIVVEQDVWYKSGTIVANLSCDPGVGRNYHVHIELYDLNRGDPGYGIPVKPECYLCGTNFDLYNCP